ncbi:MAG: hypothetical protein ACXVRM_08590, partial [Solirubrobacteraceae bacterium]
LGSLGLGSLSTTSSDPSQLVDYLRAVSAHTRRIGTEALRGASTTRYHAVVDLSRYPSLVPQSGRAAAKRGISTLETVPGSQRLSFQMTMDLYDYGTQPRTQVPPDSQAYDLTPLVTSAMKNIKFGCSGSSA